MKYFIISIKKLYPFLFVMCFSFNTALSCSCIAITNFCETTFFNSNIAVVKVINKSSADAYSSFDVEVTEVISGIINEQKLSVNYYATSCTEFVAVEIGDELIVNFDSTFDVEDAPYPAIEFGNCSVNYLTLKNNIISGRIFNLESTELSIEMFYNKLEECTDLSFVNPNNSYITRLFRIAENPVLTELNIVVPSIINETLELSIYNSQGKLVKGIKNVGNGQTPIDIHAFASGLYFCAFKVRDLVITRKFIKM